MQLKDLMWVITGDIKSYFDSIDHHILANLLEDKIKDQNIIDLYWKMVKAGYVEKGNFVDNKMWSSTMEVHHLQS